MGGGTGFAAEMGQVSMNLYLVDNLVCRSTFEVRFTLT